MLGTTFVSHTQPWKTPQHRQNRQKQENHVVPTASLKKWKYE